jgi:hypothetical protein
METSIKPRSALDLIAQSAIRVTSDGKRNGNQGWAIAHLKAVEEGIKNPFNVGFGPTVARMVYAWGTYADHHLARYGSPIGNDGLLGPAWAKQGESIITLLNGDCDGLDCETIDRLVRDIAREHGIEDFDA